jgi:hypothetical protein
LVHVAVKIWFDNFLGEFFKHFSGKVVECQGYKQVFFGCHFGMGHICSRTPILWIMLKRRVSMRHCEFWERSVKVLVYEIQRFNTEQRKTNFYKLIKIKQKNATKMFRYFNNDANVVCR